MKIERLYKHVVRDRDRYGNERVYLRIPGRPKIRLRQDPGTAEFDAEYTMAVAGLAPTKKGGKPPIQAGTLRAFTVAYYGSVDFKQLGKRTQQVRRLILDKLVEQHGEKPMARLDQQGVKMLRDSRADKPEAANGILKALRALFRFAVDAGLCQHNPATAVRYMPSKPGGFHTWTEDEIRQFESVHPIGTPARLALALLLYTGQRRSDVVRIGPAHVRDGRITLVQEKNRAHKPVTVSLPIIPALQAVLDMSELGDEAYLISALNKPFTAAGFGNRFRAWCNEAGLPNCSAHGLRKATATRLAEHGATAHELMAVLGHSTLKQVSLYTAAAARKTLADSAMARLSNVSDDKNKSHSTGQTVEWDSRNIQPTEKIDVTENMVPRGGFEPPTLRFSVACSTN